MVEGERWRSESDERSDDELGDGTASHLSLAGQRCFSGIQEWTAKEPVTQNPLVQVEESQLPSVVAVRPRELGTGQLGALRRALVCALLSESLPTPS